MEVRIIVETAFENGTTKRHRLGRLSRPFRRRQPEGVGRYRIIARGGSTHSSAGSRSKRRAFAVAPAMQNPMVSWAERFRLSLTIFRIDRPRTCDAFKANVERSLQVGGNWALSSWAAAVRRGQLDRTQGVFDANRPFGKRCAGL
jgi:hypothetical protein